MYSGRKGNGQKPPRTKPTRQKPPDKTPQTRTPRTKTNLPVKTYVCMHVLLKTRGGVSRCVTYFGGVPRCVAMCDRGRGSKLVQNSVMYFMDGPSAVSSVSSEGAGQIRQAFASSLSNL